MADLSSNSKCKKSRSSKVKLYSKPIRPSTTNGEPKAKLRTSKDVYNRLKWDPTCTSLDIDTDQVYIGYKDRFLGMCEVKFTDFNPCADDGDIPFHRIYYFRGGGPPVSPLIGKDGEIAVREDNWPRDAVIYWDRDTRLDLIFNSGETFSDQSAWKRRGKSQLLSEPPSGYQVVPGYQFCTESHTWTVATIDVTNNPVDVKEIKVLTLNILHEFYEQDFFRPSERWPYLIDFLEDSNADVLALQEVTPKFLTLLENVEWVQRNYFLSDISSSSKTIRPYGQLFVTKFSPRQIFYTEQYSKRFVIATFTFAKTNVAVANVHFTSNCKGDSAKLRQKQLQQVITAASQLQPKHTVMIVGDTNFGNDETAADKLGIDDVWSSHGDGTPGWTYDIENPLAKRNSRGTTQARFDRIFVSSQGATVVPLEMKVTGNTPINLEVPPRCRSEGQSSGHVDHQLFLSDHFALEWKFAIMTGDQDVIATTVPTDSVTTPGPVHTSAVAIIPPSEVWSKIQEIRARFDSAYDRWPPHVNLLYGFVPDDNENFTEAQTKFGEMLKNFEPIKIHLSELGSFEHSRQTTIYLTMPSAEARIVSEIQSQLQKAYPTCVSAQGQGSSPHLTVAKVPTVESAELIRQLSSELLEPPIEFELNQIHLISRQFNNPFRIRNTIRIGKSVPTSKSSWIEALLSEHRLQPSSTRIALEQEVIQEMTVLCQNVAETSVHLVGSSALSFHDDSSDIDILVCGPQGLNHHQFFQALTNSAATSGSQIRLNSVVLDTLVPIGRFTFFDVDIDLVYCPCGANNWNNVSFPELVNQSEAYVRSIDGILEMTALLSLIPSDWWTLYRKCVRVLKFWAKRRNIYSSPIGYLSSNSLSLLLAKVILTSKLDPAKTSPEQVVISFFEFYAAWKWPSTVSFHEAESAPTIFSINNKVPELMPICAPSYPYLNRTRNVTKSTRRLITKEILRANRILAEIGPSDETKFEGIFALNDFSVEYLTYVQIWVKYTDSEDMAVTKGILTSRLVRVVVDLQKQCQLECYPYTNILSPVPNTLVAVLGCDVGVGTADVRSITGCAESLETLMSAYVTGKVKVTIKHTDSMRPPDGYGAVSIDIEQIADPTHHQPVEGEVQTDDRSIANVRWLRHIGLGSLAVLVVGFGLRRYWK